MENRHQYHFLYKTTNLLNNKYYIGVHSTYNLDDGYLGSGTKLRRSINKYGKENFKIQILEFFENRDELVEAEKRMVTESLVADKMCMNLKPGGSGGFNEYWVKRGSELAVEALKEKRKDDEWMKMLSEKLSRSLSGRLLTEEHKEKLRVTSTGYRHTDEAKQKIGKLASINQSGEKNSQYGKSKSDEVRRKISETLKLKHKNGEVNSHLYGAFWVSNDELQISKKLKKDDVIPDGWYRGKKYL
jgi:hypothetical protein